jgi:hypothetical protein
MGWLPIMEQGKPVACQREWPLFYMNDFSRLGLVVNRLNEALVVLRGEGFTVTEETAGVEIVDHDHLARVLRVLGAHGHSCEMSDLISCVYQG